MRGRWKARMARDLIRHEDPEAVMELVEALLPTIVEVLPKAELTIFIERLFVNHLGTLLRDLNHQERAELLDKVFPVIVREFPMIDEDLSAT
jgi:Mg/Co/Ni transporter MgtE